MLAVVYRAARELFPLSADHVGCVTVYIDQLKAEGDIESLCATAGIRNLWMLVREGEREAVVKKYVLLDNISLTAPKEPHHSSPRAADRQISTRHGVVHTAVAETI